MPNTAVSEGTPAQSKKWESSKHTKWIWGECHGCFRAAFDLSVQEVRQTLAKCDLGCPNGHYTKSVHSLPVGLRGHPIVCDSCTSTLKILRAASTHFPVLRKFLSLVSDVLSAHKIMCEIDDAYKNGNHQNIMRITRVKSLLSSTIDQNYQKLSEIVECSDFGLRRPTLETKPVIAHAALIAGFEKEIDDFPVNACICCEHLHQRKSVSVVSFSDDFNSGIWRELKAHVLKYPPTVSGQVIYYYCKQRVKADKMPARCFFFNGLQNVPIPPELAKLDLLSRQLIVLSDNCQVRYILTYTGKVPTYNSLKACKGTTFFSTPTLE